MTAILNLAVALLAGLLMTRIFSRWHLPDVTAFLVTGVLIGPFVLGRLGIPGLGFASYDQVEALSMISDVAMGFIAFSIGNEFRLSQLKKTGRQAMIIGVLQALAALAFVDIALVIFHFLRPDVLSVPAAITLGAIATATAPATTLMVVRQYKAKGELTDLLLPIVALDDAVALIAFGFAVTVAKTLNSASDVNIAMSIAEPFIELGISIVVGAAAAAGLSILSNCFIVYPIYEKIMSPEAILSMYRAIDPSVRDLTDAILRFNTPFTFCKELISVIITFLIYKRLSPLLHGRKKEHKKPENRAAENDGNKEYKQSGESGEPKDT